jgi:ATP-binding cassette, subfamily G (WHITE), member 2, PDR
MVIGLNVEQRKRVTIGIELAARPELLLFLDEPTSGLDSDTAWSICTLLRKLADHGQAILCTIHQPSPVLLQMFDRLIFLSEGKSVYFGDLGRRAETLTSYFERHGARRCGPSENPAEWLLTITGNGPNSSNTVDWAEVWRTSDERAKIKNDISVLKDNLSKTTEPMEPMEPTVDAALTPAIGKYATSTIYQLYVVTKRTLQHDWRTPSYLWAKTLTTFGMVRYFTQIFYEDALLVQYRLTHVL